MPQLYDLSITLNSKTEDQILRYLQAEVAQRSKAVNPLKAWPFWAGFIWGCIFIAAMDYGDVRLCVGQRDDSGGLRTAPVQP